MSRWVLLSRRCQAIGDAVIAVALDETSEMTIYQRAGTSRETLTVVECPAGFECAAGSIIPENVSKMKSMGSKIPISVEKWSILGGMMLTRRTLIFVGRPLSYENRPRNSDQAFVKL